MRNVTSSRLLFLHFALNIHTSDSTVYESLRAVLVLDIIIIIIRLLFSQFFHRWLLFLHIVSLMLIVEVFFYNYRLCVMSIARSFYCKTHILCVLNGESFGKDAQLSRAMFIVEYFRGHTHTHTQ